MEDAIQALAAARAFAAPSRGKLVHGPRRRFKAGPLLEAASYAVTALPSRLRRDVGVGILALRDKRGWSLCALSGAVSTFWESEVSPKSLEMLSTAPQDNAFLRVTFDRD